MRARLLTLSSLLARLVCLLGQYGPHLPIYRYTSYLSVALFLAALPKWLRSLSRPVQAQTVRQFREVEVSPTRNREYPVKRIKQEIRILSVPARAVSPLRTLLLGLLSNEPRLNIANLLLNTLLILWTLDQTISPILLLSCQSLSYARISQLSSSSATINIRSPAAQPNEPSTFDHSTARIAHRPLLAAELRSEESPVSWSVSPPIRVSKEDDWLCTTQLAGLHPSLQYEYRIYPGAKPSTFASLNFTTPPDARLSHGQNFRFIHAGSPSYYPLPHNPLAALPALLPLTYSLTTPSPSHVYHRWRSYHLRQPAWRQLADWLADLRERTAWTQVEFALIGSGLESTGSKAKPMSLRTSSDQRRIRQVMASQDVRDVYENLPVLAALPRSPSQGGVVEPGSVSIDRTTFQYGAASFYRLRGPFQEMNQEDSVDWLNDTRDLRRWLLDTSNVGGFRFITAPQSLAPWIGGRKHAIAWREAVLDAISPFKNVIVLAESRRGFTASLLRGTLVEFASPPFTAPPPSRFWPKSIVPPRLTKSPRDGRISMEGSEKTNRLIKALPAGSGARWTTIEVDSSAKNPRLVVFAYADGQPEWRLEVVGATPQKHINALGSVSESFFNLLRRFGFLGKRWG